MKTRCFFANQIGTRCKSIAKYKRKNGNGVYLVCRKHRTGPNRAVIAPICKTRANAILDQTSKTRSVLPPRRRRLRRGMLRAAAHPAGVMQRYNARGPPLRRTNLMTPIKSVNLMRAMAIAGVVSNRSLTDVNNMQRLKAIIVPDASQGLSTSKRTKVYNKQFKAKQIAKPMPMFGCMCDSY